VLLLAWAAIAALAFAWARSIRSRELASALRQERAELARLAEMNLAAAGLAHETRNPLGIILGLAHRLAEDPETSPSHVEAAEQIMDEADRAAARLSDFIHFARLPEPTMASTSLDALLQRVRAALLPDFEQADVRLEMAATDALIECDPDMLEQIVVNLLLNSLQASEPGTTTSLALSRTRGQLTLKVVDQGCGIDPELLPDVFKPYVTGRPEGHGLGLAIVRRLVDELGWEITVDSQVGRGTTFAIAGIRVLTSEAKA